MNPPDRSNFAGDYDRVQFNISLEGVIRKAGLNSQGTMFTRSRQFVCFTDDLTKHVVTKVARASKSHHQVYQKQTVVLYDRETWAMLKADLKALEVFESDECQ